MEELESLEEELRQKLAGKEETNIAKKTRKRPKEYEEDDVDDFYDRTKSTKQSKTNDVVVETQESLTHQWKTLVSQYAALVTQIARAEGKIINDKLVFDRDTSFVGLESEKPAAVMEDETCVMPPPPI
eukprot:11729285-Ditylum_brightwellii.AAC.1